MLTTSGRRGPHLRRDPDHRRLSKTSGPTAPRRSVHAAGHDGDNVCFGGPGLRTALATLSMVARSCPSSGRARASRQLPEPLDGSPATMKPEGLVRSGCPEARLRYNPRRSSRSSIRVAGGLAPPGGGTGQMGPRICLVSHCRREVRRPAACDRRRGADLQHARLRAFSYEVNGRPRPVPSQTSSTASAAT
jgi:hypothetical protein